MTAIEEIGRYGDVPIDIEAQLDRQMMRVRQLLALDRGDVIPLLRSAGDNADILAGGAPLASGEILVVDDRLAVRITDFPAEPARD